MVNIILTDHAKLRLFQREIDVHEAKYIAKNGKITEIQIDGTIVKTGTLSNGKKIEIAIIKAKNKLIIKSVYYEDYI